MSGADWFAGRSGPGPVSDQYTCAALWAWGASERSSRLTARITIQSMNSSSDMSETDLASPIDTVGAPRAADRPPGTSCSDTDLLATLFDLGREVTSVLDFRELLEKIPQLISAAHAVFGLRRLSAR